MKKTLKSLAAAGCLVPAASAMAIDTSEPFLCAVTQVNECLDGYGCEAVLPEMVNAPTFIWVDLKKKRIRTSVNNDGSRILNQMNIDGRHVIQGAEDGNPNQVDGVAWSMSIEDDTGRFVGAVAMPQASVTLFGACTETSP
jgi:hypothetical protein